MDASKPLKYAPHERYCQEYIIDLVAKDAYIRADYKARGHAAEVNASNLLKRPKVRARVDYLLAEKAKRTGITADRVVKEIACIAFFDPAQVFDDEGRLLTLTKIPESARRAIAGIKIKRLPSKGQDAEPEELVEIKLAPKSPSHDQLMKHVGGYKEDNKQKSLLLPSDEELERIRGTMATQW